MKLRLDTIPLLEIRSEFLRFLIAGGLQTTLSYLFFLLMAKFLAYSFAYSLTYCAGILLSYFLHVILVFRTQVGLSSFLKFPLVYVVQYLFGLVLLWLFVDSLGIAPAYAMLGVIALTVPITFLTSRFLLKNS